MAARGGAGTAQRPNGIPREKVCQFKLVLLGRCVFVCVCAWIDDMVWPPAWNYCLLPHKITNVCVCIYMYIVCVHVFVCTCTRMCVWVGTKQLPCLSAYLYPSSTPPPPPLPLSVTAGESAVGKSSLVLRFVKGQFHEYQESTIGGGLPTCVSYNILSVCTQEHVQVHVYTV